MWTSGRAHGAGACPGRRRGDGPGDDRCDHRHHHLAGRRDHARRHRHRQRRGDRVRAHNGHRRHRRVQVRGAAAGAVFPAGRPDRLSDLPARGRRRPRAHGEERLRDGDRRRDRHDRGDRRGRPRGRDLHRHRPDRGRRRARRPDPAGPRHPADCAARAVDGDGRHRLQRRQRRHLRPAAGVGRRRLGGRELLPGQRPQHHQLPQRRRLVLGAVRVRRRGPGQDRRLRGRVRALHRRRGEHGHQERDQLVPRRGERVLRAEEPAGAGGRTRPTRGTSRRRPSSSRSTPRSAARSSRTSCSSSASCSTATPTNS